MKNQSMIYGTVVLALGLLSGTAAAGISGGNLIVSAVIADACTVTLTPASQPLYSGTPASGVHSGLPAGSLSILCSGGMTSVQVCAGRTSTNYTSTSTDRMLSDGGTGTIAWDLWFDAAVSGFFRIGDGGCNGVDGSYAESYTAENSKIIGITSGTLVTRDFRASMTLTGAELGGAYTESVPVTVVW